MEADGLMPVDSPIDGSEIGYAQRASAPMIEEIVEKLDGHREEIASIPPHKRAEMLEKVADLILEHSKILSDVLVTEAGKPMHEASGEVNAAAERLKLVYQDLGRLLEVAIPGGYGPGTESKRAVIIRVPIGVVAAITPFNYPLFSAVAKIGPALLAGDPVIFKPASNTPIIGALIARLFAEAGFSRFLAFVTGPGGSIGDAIVSHPLVKAITFTGSSQVGKRISRVAGLKKMHMELGGKAPALVLEDADLELAADRIAYGAYRLSGQRCDAISRVIVVKSVADRLVELLEEKRDEWKLGDPRDPSTKIGPLIDRKAAERVESLVADAIERGAELVGGGSRWNLYFQPTLLGDVPLTARISWEETFGPVIPIIKVEDEGEAVKISNESVYGLDSAVFTSSVERAWRLALAVEAGGVTVNDFPRHGLGLFPFGGVKDSGKGREGVGYSLDELTELKTMVFKL